MCVHVMKQKKCHYIGNCSFAHSSEERDVWTYMKNNSCECLAFSSKVKLHYCFCGFKNCFSVPLAVRDMQQMYDLWLSLTNQNRRSDGPLMTPPPEEKQNAMPADFTDSVVGDF